MLKKLVALIAIVSLTLIPISPVNAAVKAGTACPKAGNTAIASGKTFTCIQSGKKLVWDKGKENNPSNSNGLSTSSTAQNSIPALTKPISFENLDPYWTSVTAYQNVRNFAQEQAKPNLISQIYLSPNLGNRPYESYLYGLEEIAKLWGPIFKSPNINIILFTELDSDWIDQKQKDLMGKYLRNPSSQLQSNRLKESGCNIGGFYLPNLIVFCVKDDKQISSRENLKLAAYSAFPHEYTHFVGMTSPEINNLGIDSIGRLSACWFWEGSATFYGYAIAGKSLDKFDQYRLSSLHDFLYTYDQRRNQQLGTLIKKLQENNPETVIDLFRELENDVGSCKEIHNAYALGEMATETLVAIYGQTGINNLILEFGKSNNWPEAFQKTFGLSLTDFYIKITPYLASQAKLF